MSELVEKVAEMFEEALARHGIVWPEGTRDDAQAAIAAVLEHLSVVTPEMVAEGRRAYYTQPDGTLNADRLKAAYLAMLAKVKP